LENLLEQVNCDLAIADQFGDERFVLNALQEKGKRIRLIQRTKAESDLAVAAASILARAEFLLRLKRLSDDIGLALPKGASPQVELAGRMIVKNTGRNGWRRWRNCTSRRRRRCWGLNRTAKPFPPHHTLPSPAKRERPEPS